MPNVRTVADMAATPEIISRAEARERGLNRYRLARPCNHGHYSERTVSDAHCVACKRVRAKNHPPPSARNEVRLDRYGGYWKAYYQRNRERKIGQVVSRARERRKSDPIFRLAHNLRSRLSTAVMRDHKSGSMIALLGCSIEELKRRLEQQFAPGMSWENWGQWHIDHRKPLASFNLSDPTEQAAAFHFSNLQPLWAADNLAKGARYVA